MGLHTDFARRRQRGPRGVAVEYSLHELWELDAANDAAEALMEMQRAELVVSAHRSLPLG